MHPGQFDVGQLVAPPGDLLVAEFMGALDRVNGLGKRMPGFDWMMEGSGEPGTGDTAAKIGGDPRLIANLTVWMQRASGGSSTPPSTRGSTPVAPSGSRC
jgi:hypothetical protein